MRKIQGLGDFVLVNESLKQYLEDNVVCFYNKNDKAHDKEHLYYVLNRALGFAENLNVDHNILITIVYFHDVAHHINKKEHEKLSADMFLKCTYLKSFFTDEQRKIIYEAIIDHRASSSSEPRSIYGKIVSTADRNISVESILKRTYQYRMQKKELSNINEVIEESYNHILSKYGKDGYARNKVYFEDHKFNIFLNEIDILLSNKNDFIKVYKKVNNIKEGV